MPSHGLAVNTHSTALPIHADRVGLVIVRRLLQGLGGGAAVGFAALMPWVEFSAAGLSVGRTAVPPAALIGVAAIILVGLGFFVNSVWGLIRRLPAKTVLGVAGIAVLTALSLAGLEYGYLRTGGLSAYEYRPAARLACYALGIALFACAVPEHLGPRVAVMIRQRTLKARHIAALALAVLAAGALIGFVVLDGMPHVIDATTYLLEARTLWSGRLTLDVPMYLPLFERELLEFRVTDAGYFGKYPVGWPLVLGMFDAAGVPWLANAVLAGLLVVLTYLAVAERGGPRLAGMSAAAVALCPWLWFNAGTMMSHLASAVWLWLFLWLMLRSLRLHSRMLALLAGLSLGAAVLTRPADAAFFALPCAAFSLGWMIRRPDTWLTRLPLVAVGALPGVIAYLAISSKLAGDSASSTYGDGHAGMLFSQTPQSLGHALVWLHEGWVGVSSQWFAGAAPAALLILCGVVFGRPILRGQWLLFACAASLLLCYAVFVFGGRAWVGPRWYVPLIPAGALLIAAGLEAAARAGRVRSASGVLAAGYLRSVVVAAVVIFCVAIPARLVELRQSPPHGVDGRLVAAVQHAGLNNAVVALPVDGLIGGTDRPHYKRGIAGMWSMRTPFEDSPVIYVAAVDGWERMASEAWPGRSLYRVNGEIDDYTLKPVEVEQRAAVNPSTTEMQP